MPSSKYGLRGRRCQEAIIRGVICLPASKIRSRGEIKDRVDIAVLGQWRQNASLVAYSLSRQPRWTCCGHVQVFIAQWPHKDEHYLRAGLHKLWYPSIWDSGVEWSKFGAHGEHGDVFLFSNLGAL